MSIFAAADIAAFKADRVMLATRDHFPAGALSDAYLLQQLQAAEADISHQLKTFLEPTYVFPYTPTNDETAALDGMAWAEEPGYDYDAEFFQSESWGYLITRHAPIISIDSIQLAYPSPQQAFYTIPNTWIRPDKKYGVIRLVPAAGAFAAPLNAFIMQAMGGGSTIPSMIQVKYTAGLKNVRTDSRWADLVDVVYKCAVLKLIDGAFLPQSTSIGADGLTQTVAVDIQKYRDTLNEKLFGPKGANGGLWTTIHGMGASIIGVLA